MTRAAALEAVYRAAQAIATTFDGPRQSGTPYVTVPVHLLVALRAAVEAVGEGGAVGGDVSWDQPVPVVRAGLCQGDPHCFRYADLPSGTCHHHSGWADLPSARVVMRDEVFRGEVDG